ncbi:MAG: YbaB/EbfC family nucleoid-associated protein [Clostridiales bacterium]|nr:YbaB/EbfC family nucleoid-associated protein [Clostridiales bacterium]
MKARVPKNFGGVPGNMQGMIQQAQKMQEEITKKQAEIDEMEFTSSVGGGVVEVTVTGKKEVKAVTIKPEIVDPEEIEMLQDLVISAVNEALRQVEAKTTEEMDKITNGLNIPGLV